jgi:hypothetical protein
MESRSKFRSGRPGRAGRVLRFAWRIFCASAGALIVGGLVGFKSSSLWAGIAAAAPGAVAGWYVGKYVSPLDALFPPFAGGS